MVGDAIRTCLWREHASVSELSRDFRILEGLYEGRYRNHDRDPGVAGGSC
jgi:hypothetical protein